MAVYGVYDSIFYVLCQWYSFIHSLTHLLSPLSLWVEAIWYNCSYVDHTACSRFVIAWENPFSHSHVNIVNVMFCRTCKLAYFPPDYRLHSISVLAYEYLSMTDWKINLVKFKMKYRPNCKSAPGFLYRTIHLNLHFGNPIWAWLHISQTCKTAMTACKEWVDQKLIIA